ncbi:LacI family transcriptional regulator [Evansella caseinilytica]|uniref:LacI family transcriptional regulator n=1 Tax=Evansella caseinilytica TaxID=1503961 RepID=A0A1H3NYA5_9BACI|nr:LacI family DNA-binding transcriptional regulator [Evansella caseinilytica]SDY93874.1 LacI family transcriptional regulator [Evansella caseinilytica]
MVTIKDIAKAAGVSYSTVSKALRDSPLVKPPTKKKIVNIANELGYQPNVAARSLVSKKSDTVGVVWPTVERAAHAALITKINDQLENHGYTTLLSINKVEAAINTFNRLQVDAILMFNDQGQDGPDTPLPSNVPILSYGIAKNPLYPTVDVNRRDAIKLAVHTLVDIGHKNIAFIGDMSQRDQLQDEKVSGFTEGMKERFQEATADVLIPASGLELYDGYLAMKKFLQAGKTTTAVVSGSYDLTRGVIRALNEYNLSIPKDVSIISYDNIPQTNTFEVPISLVGVPNDVITSTITDALLNMINKKQVPQSIVLEPEIKLNESCLALE